MINIGDRIYAADNSYRNSSVLMGNWNRFDLAEVIYMGRHISKIIKVKINGEISSVCHSWFSATYRGPELRLEEFSPEMPVKVIDKSQLIIID